MRWFTVRKRWKSLEYTVWAFSLGTLALLAAFPFRVARERSKVSEAAGVLCRNFPPTLEEAQKLLSKDTLSGILVPEERRTFDRVSFQLFQGPQPVDLAGHEITSEGARGKTARDLDQVPPETSGSWKVGFYAPEGTPAWAVCFPFRDGKLVLYQPFPWAVPYSWWMVLALLLWTGLVMPLIVRKLGIRMHMVSSLFKKQIILYAVVSMMPVLLFCAVFGTAVLADLSGIHWLPSKWVLLPLLSGFLALTLFSVFLAVRDMTHRITDSLLVITNGMEMAGNLDFDRPIVAPSQDEVGLVSEIFNQVTHLLKARVNLLQALFNNIRIFSSLMSRERILDHTLKTFLTLENGADVVMAFWDDESEELVVEKTSEDRPEIIGLRFSEGPGFFGKIIKEKQFFACTGDEYSQLGMGRGSNEAKLWGDPGFLVGVPMMYKGKLQGVVAYYNLKPGDFEADLKKDYLQGLGNQIAIFLENARLYGMVIRDRLTGLYVHSFIEAELENLLAQAKRYQFPVSFLMFDVDKFKQINDNLGHAAGNKVLQTVAQEVLGFSRDSDLVARYGGDEFEIVLPHTDKEGALVYAQKLREKIEALRVEISPGVEARVTLSIGLSTFPKDAANVSELLVAADQALYGAKALGRNCVVMYQTKAT